jgi:hypothetical protein
MSENSIADKYKIPQEIIIQKRIDDNFSWDRIVGRPDIKTVHDVRFYEATSDSVSSTNLFNISDVTFVINCKLPYICEPLDNNFYIGGWNYYSELRNCNEIYAFDFNGDLIDSYSYSSGDLYTQEYNGTEVKFKVNGCTFATSRYVIPNNPLRDFMYFGFFNATSSSERNIHIRGINCYSSGSKGLNGNDGNNVYVGVGIPENTYGESGDFYYNIASRSLYGRKIGICGSLFFDGIQNNNTRLSIPNDEDLRLGTEPFTIEWFQYMTSDTNGTILSIGDSMAIGFGIENSEQEGQGIVFYANGTSYFLDFQQFEQRWIHIAITHTLLFDVSILNLHIDGVWQDSQPFDENLNNTTDPLIIGNIGINNIPVNYKGYMTNLRIIKGQAIYVSQFDVPRETLEDVPGTVLLLNADSLSNAFVDSSSKNKTVTNNNVMWDPSTPYKSEGTWDTTTPILLNDVSFPIGLGGGEYILWDFKQGGYKSVIIYLSCIASSDNQPLNVTVITVNNGINGPKILNTNNLPTNVSIISVFNENESYVYATCTAEPSYNISSVRVIPLL